MLQVEDCVGGGTLPECLPEIEEEFEHRERTLETAHQEGEFWELSEQVSEVVVGQLTCEGVCPDTLVPGLELRQYHGVRKTDPFKLNAERQMNLMH